MWQECMFLLLLAFVVLPRIARKFCSYKMALNSDAPEFGGHNRLQTDQEYRTYPEGYAGRAHHMAVYIPSRYRHCLSSLWFWGDLIAFRVGIVLQKVHD